MPDASSEHAHPHPEAYPYNLGTHSFRVNTTSPACQRWFDFGLNWYYAFFAEEATACFRHAIAADPLCAMAHAGVALARGPNFAMSSWIMMSAQELEEMIADCYDESRRALELVRDPLERAICNGVAARWPARHRLDKITEYEAWDEASADAYAASYAEYESRGEAVPVELAALYTAQLMNVRPRKWFNDMTGEPSVEARTELCEGLLKDWLDRPEGRNHPGLLHWYIHLLEFSPRPEEAVNAGDRLRGLVPDSGHMNHMPGHLDVLIGDYRAASSTNLVAILADEKFLAHTGGQWQFYHGSITHNMSFPIYAGMLSAQRALTLATLDRFETVATDTYFRSFSGPLQKFLVRQASYRVHAYVRFGMWHEVLDLPFREDAEFYTTDRTMQLYARTVALSVLGRIPEAERELELFKQAAAGLTDAHRAVPVWEDLYAIAEHMATGELAYRRGEYASAFEHLRRSIEVYDNLKFVEPYAWMQPPRHAYAALQLEQGNVDEAARAYAEDLGYVQGIPRKVQRPNNVWALHGYHECLTRQGRDREAAQLKPLLNMAMAIADIKIEASCFCRRADAEDGGKASCCEC